MKLVCRACQTTMEVDNKRLKICPQCRSSNVEIILNGSIDTLTQHSPNQAIDSIRKALETRDPSKSRILKSRILEYLLNLQANASISKFEFFDIIGTILQIRPEFFMVSIYPKMRGRLSVIYGAEGMREMDKYILERFCFSQGEQIIYELNGRISQITNNFKGRVKGTIYITNYGIIAHGKFKSFYLGGNWDPLTPEIFKRKSWGFSPKGEHDFLIRSITQYGYKFPTVNLHGLKMGNRSLRYFINNDLIKIIPSRIEEHRDKLFAILSKFQKQN